MAHIEIVRIKFRWPGKIYEFRNPQNIALKRNDRVVVEGFGRETLVGVVSVAPRIREKRHEDDDLHAILRIAAEEDLQFLAKTDEFRSELKRFFDTRVRSRETSGVKMVDCELVDQGRKLIVYYSSETKDFDYRGMAKEIAQKYGLRADMRHVGVRDAARLAGGIGRCGLSTCCSTWISDFKPVTIKMAKDQGVSLEPESVNGQCGRLLCCLGYEHDNYVALGADLPKVGKAVITPQGEGRVTKLDIIKGLVSVRLEDGNYEQFKGSEVQRKFGPRSGGKDSKD
ncbi:MAG: regulatory iron-sulfur-containing complex subunit RicT [Bdellovibrionota bacterium]